MKKTVILGSVLSLCLPAVHAKGTSILGEDPATSAGQYENVANRLERTYEASGEQKIWYQYGRPMWKKDRPAPVAKISAEPIVEEPISRASYPINARPGQCFSKVIIPAKFETKNEKVLVSPKLTKFRAVPAQFSNKTKNVLVSEATEKIVSVPATYKYIRGKVLVTGESERLVKIPAKFKTISKRIKVRDEVVEWKRGDQPGQADENDALCLVKKPAVFKTVTEKILVRPESFQTVKTPAVYKRVTRRVVKTPATVKRVFVPAQYKKVVVSSLSRPAERVRYEESAKYRTLTKRVKVADSRTEWRQVLCKTNTSSAKIRNIQRALRNSGFNPGRIDGHLGEETARAVRRYQLKKGIPTGGLTLETVESLNVR